MNARTMMLTSLLTCGALVLGACGSDADGDAGGPAPTGSTGTEVSATDTVAVVSHYADGVYATYRAAVTSATALQTDLAAFVANPTEQAMTAAKDQWLAARNDYLVTEAFRFYDGPIDNPDNGPEGQINAWPMDEAYVDGVVGDESAGIINNDADYPEITEDVLLSANEDGGETNISTGWHAIEFLLWGQDMSDTGPGARPVSDYTTSPTASRRATYLTLLGDLLVSDLTSVRDQWDPEAGDNFRTEFLADPDRAIADMFRGIGALTVGELTGERIAVAIETKDQEDEHSCFSDNTNADIRGDILGIQGVYLGTYPGVGNGPGLDSLVEQIDPATNAALVAQIQDNLELASSYPTTFERMIAGDSAPLDATVDGLTVQGEAIAQAADALGVDVDTGV